MKLKKLIYMIADTGTAARKSYGIPPLVSHEFRKFMQTRVAALEGNPDVLAYLAYIIGGANANGGQLYKRHHSSHCYEVVLTLVRIRPTVKASVATWLVAEVVGSSEVLM